MISNYYQQELYHLKELAVEFSKAHPALAPLLSGPGSDPDVERLLEGTAFLTGLVREKLDDEFPEIVHNLLRIIFPHYLRPIPSATVIQFTPKPGLMEILHVPQGAGIASVPVDDTRCVFTTCYDVDIHPLKLSGVNLVKNLGKRPRLVFSFDLTGISLAEWNPKSLRLLIGGSLAEAADRYRLLLTHAQQVTFSAGDTGESMTLPGSCLKPVGFADNEALFPYPPNSFPGFRLLQEYFVMPHKFLFIDITGLDKWKNKGRGAKFTISITLDSLPQNGPDFKTGHFILSATPAVNLFKHGAEPILLDHKRTYYRVRSSDQHINNFQVYDIKNVVGFIQGTVKQRKYVPFEMFRPRSDDVAVYQVSQRNSATDDSMALFLSVAYPPDAPTPVPETLSIELLCTNFRLPESLQVGDINQPTETSPSLTEFKNISQPSAAVQPPLGRELLWRLLSHISLNYLPIANAENLKALLRLYIFPDTRDRASVVANNKRVDGVLDLKTSLNERILHGHILRGNIIELTLSSQNFASLGDMYLFGSVLDTFFGSYSSLNSFTQFKIIDHHTGESYEWPLRTGDRPLI